MAGLLLAARFRKLPPLSPRAVPQSAHSLAKRTGVPFFSATLLSRSLTKAPGDRFWRGGLHPSFRNSKARRPAARFSDHRLGKTDCDRQGTSRDSEPRMAGRSKRPLEHPSWFTGVTWVITVGPMSAVPNLPPPADPNDAKLSAKPKRPRRSDPSEAPPEDAPSEDASPEDVQPADAPSSEEERRRSA